MMPSWSWFVKRLIIFDVIWGGRSKKLAGIPDGKVFLVTNVTFLPPNQIKINQTALLPKWVKPKAKFRIRGGGGGNNTRLFEIKTVDRDNKVITVVTPTEAPMLPFTGTTVMDGRQWALINNAMIARPSSRNGNTIYNVNYNGPNGVPRVFAEHFHANSDGIGGPVGSGDNGTCTKRFNFYANETVLTDSIPFLLADRLLRDPLLTQEEPVSVVIGPSNVIEIPNIQTVPLIAVYVEEIIQEDFMLSVMLLAQSTLTTNLDYAGLCKKEPVSVCLVENVLTITMDQPYNGVVVLSGLDEYC